MIRVVIVLLCIGIAAYLFITYAQKRADINDSAAGVFATALCDSHVLAQLEERRQGFGVRCHDGPAEDPDIVVGLADQTGELTAGAAVGHGDGDLLNARELQRLLLACFGLCGINRAQAGQGDDQSGQGLHGASPSLGLAPSP